LQPICWCSTEETKPNTTKANNTRTTQFKLYQKNKMLKPNPKTNNNNNNNNNTKIYNAHM